MWIALGLSMGAQYWVIKKKWFGFLLCLVADVMWIGTNLYFGLPQQVIIFCFAFCIALTGMIKWIRDEKKINQHVVQKEAPE